MRVLVAIPCLNEDVAIGSVVLRARPHADEVLVVDDGSTDRTAEVARLAGATVVSHAKNGGKGKAYETLWAYANEKGFDALVVLDGDGQHDAGEIPLLLAKLQEGADVVVGSRWGDRTQMPLWRRAGKRILDYATKVGSDSNHGKMRVTDSQSGFRAYSARSFQQIQPQHAGFSIESHLLIAAHGKGLSIREVPIHCRYDVEGSTENPIRHASTILNELLVQIGIIHPLLFLGFPGFLCLLGGMVSGTYALIIYRQTEAIALGSILLSAVLVIIGVLGLFAGLLFNILPRVLAASKR